MTLIERAARAIHDNTRQYRYVRDCDKPDVAPEPTPMPFVEWDDIGEKAQDDLIRQVRGFLEVIRDPYEEGGVEKEIWQAMIDAALAEGRENDLQGE